MTKKIFAIGNAHLDPVWMWRWQEGSAEAKATIRSALDRMKEYPEFKFVCSSASVYKWIEEFDPKMFEEIQARVAEGRFIIVGGWLVQPDCNIPSGEGFARQSLYNQRYFYKKFGKTAEVGYNVDSFGHNYMIPQILKKSGMNEYIFMRPAPHENKLDDKDVFYWYSPDGSNVLTVRIRDPYCFNFNSAFVMNARIKFLRSKMSVQNIDDIIFMYGVGNHGGGPTKKNIELLLEYDKKNNGEVVFADPKEFFASVRNSGVCIPEWHDDLQHHAAGCYAAVSAIKAHNRRAENALGEAEMFSFMSHKLLDRKFPLKQIEDGWEGVCFNHFHDIMGGCAIKEAYSDAIALEGYSETIAERLKNNALQTVSWAIDTSDAESGVPIVVFNPHPFEVTGPVIINKQTDHLYDDEGNKVTVQYLFSSTHTCYRRRDTLFIATVPALGYRIYYMRKQGFLEAQVSELGRIKYAVKRAFTFACGNTHASDSTLENDKIKVIFDKNTGRITSFIDKSTGKNVFSAQAAVPVVIDESDHDTWSHGKNYFDKFIGEFKCVSCEALENGPLKATIKVISKYENSTLVQYFSLFDGDNKLCVRTTVDWHEKHRMLKLKFPIAVQTDKVAYEVPFGYIDRPLNGEEEPVHSWMCMKEKDGMGVALLNDGKYSASAKDGAMFLTVVRSPIYGDHGWPRASESPYTDQGEQTFNYAVMPLNKASVADIIRSAKLFNVPMTNIIENNHIGSLGKTESLIKVSKKNIMVSAIKRSEEDDGYIVRAYETDGTGADAEITIKGLAPLVAKFTPYSCNTYKLADGTTEWKEVLMTEFDIK